MYVNTHPVHFRLSHARGDRVCTHLCVPRTGERACEVNIGSALSVAVPRPGTRAEPRRAANDRRPRHNARRALSGFRTGDGFVTALDRSSLSRWRASAIAIPAKRRAQTGDAQVTCD
ncbi:hypothetical protein NP493_746g02028 [Ridgeia piscesae]|uniref:Uncharacterized protein n=1 Tax=Ridgeia piscesae TaxID=27915 RepID=A0AAD9KP68_RIDPI|nr:hypothetical protein NP493_746g02028 [Ridgeia piscesae]